MRCDHVLVQLVYHIEEDAFCGDIRSTDSLRPLEKHVFKKVGNSRLTRTLVNPTNAILHHEGDSGDPLSWKD